ncbi:MAG: EAL domain-containing protein [Rhodocyclaceae bacterium]|nr:EAL domain-containing protein [Rhodocyclaceae bacterium]
MDERTRPPRAAKDLRKRAEASLEASDERMAGMSEAEIRRLAHELQVHQIELQMQNEDLREAQAQLEQSRDRYNDLYEHAPVGYLTLSAKLQVREANLTVAAQLGLEKRALIGRRFSDLVAPASQSQMHLEWRSALANDVHHIDMELEMRRGDGSTLFVQLSCMRERGGTPDDTTYRCALTDVSARREVENLRLESARQMEFMAHHDALTGLGNRAMFQKRVSHALTRAQRQKRDVALLYLDLDGFKQVNDSFGHEVGDQLLIAAAQRLLACVRAEDILARLGGDEFGIVLEEVSEAWGAALVADKVIDALTAPFLIDGRELILGVSVGVCLFPTDGKDASELIRNADIAMYQAKHHGGNVVQFYTPALSDAVRARVDTESALRRAIEGGELEIFYQPMMALATQHIVGAEALLRWRDPRRGLLLPDRFLPVAELSGLIVQVGNCVIDEVCRQIAAWQQQRLSIPRISVNVSARQCANGEVVDVLAAALARHGVAASALDVEITESCYLDKSAITTVLPALRDIGVSLTIDDFGTGYASLASLRHVPVTTIKIDRAFVAEIRDASSDGAIARAVVALGESQGLRVIAEGVEDATQLAALGAMGCEVCQGFLIAAPMPADHFATWLADNQARVDTP